MHESGEMYLETIYVLSQNSQSVRSLDVAEHMGFSKPSVSRAIGLLKKKGMLYQIPTVILNLHNQVWKLPEIFTNAISFLPKCLQ